MSQQRIFVSVVGFSDVERHALNTVFRLSEARELAYALWVAGVVPGAGPVPAPAEVALVDGDSAEAVLSHARESPPGQRLIWIGHDAPAHAWRVLDRPIQWADVLNDLDAVFAARQVDSGYLDLDVTMPGLLAAEPGAPVRRALLLGLDRASAARVRARLAQAGVPEADEALSTELALDLIARNAYCCGLFNLDEHRVDAWSLARLFADSHPQSLRIGLSEHGSPLAAWWNRRRVRRDTRRAGISVLLSRPLRMDELSPWLERL